MSKHPQELADTTLDQATGGTERVTLNYEEVKWTYTTQDSNKGAFELTEFTVKGER
ncbi:MAG: hypothetical protein AAGC81_08030 [Pseudomonadota bacterium]